MDDRVGRRGSGSLADKLLLVLAMLAFAPAAQALPPFITDDTGTQGDGRWQLELIGERVRHKHSADVDGASVTQLRHSTSGTAVLTRGFGERLDLAVTLAGLANRVEENGKRQEKSSGLGDVVLEAKWRFYERGGTSLALKPSLSLPTGDENRGLGTGKSSYAINLILTHEAGPWALMANAAFIRPRFRREEDERGNRSHLRRYSAGATYEVAEHWRLAAELGYRTNPARDDSFLPGRNGGYGMLGAIWSFSKDDDLALGVRRAASSSEYDWAFIAGATFRW
jgi:Putative MetA-pathway of phenol degradation